MCGFDLKPEKRFQPLIDANLTLMRKGIRESAKISADQRFLLHFLETEKRYRIQLPPELSEHLYPMPYAAAPQMEKDLAEEFKTGFSP
jgi:hypothetical protein